MPSQRIIQLCTGSDTVTSTLAGNPEHDVASIAKRLFKTRSVDGKEHEETPVSRDSDPMGDVLKCGKFPYRPSDLFLKIYSDVLETLEHDPLADIVSPPLIGSSGVIPLTIASVIPDIMRHYADLIVRAQHEVFLATNYWELSSASSLVSESLRELSRRVGDRKGKKVVVKLMFDRGTPKQVLKNHSVVKPDRWHEVNLPKPEEIPYLDLEVVNYHRPALGTFHAKYIVVDRKIACLNSNNIQDRPNVEMMIHLEGPVVEGFYDMALLSWSNAMHPPLPLLGSQTAYGDDYPYTFLQDNPALTYIDPREAGKASLALLKEQTAKAEQAEESMTFREAIRRGTQGFVAEDSEVGYDKTLDERMKIPSRSPPTSAGESPPDSLHESTPPGIQNQNQPEPSKPEEAELSPRSPPTSVSPPDSLQESTTPEIQNQQEQLKPGKAEDKSPKPLFSSASDVAMHLNAGIQDTKPTVKEDDCEASDFSPHIFHQPHKPCPMAMVNRKPRGTPGHGDVHKVPQNVAWLGAFKYAKKNVFIQTPTFNASPVIPACLDACRRGIEVTLYLDLGFNDKGEMIPFQGGTNEQVVAEMYRILNAEGKQENLKVYWYTGKDQLKPMAASARKRNCHVKFCSVDDEVAILGNGNQDTQSWFHSQEINLMVNSRDLVADWLKGLNANQNTGKYGRVSTKDGVWRDEEGNVLQSSGTEKLGLFSRLKGVTGAVARVKSKGGF